MCDAAAGSSPARPVRDRLSCSRQELPEESAVARPLDGIRILDFTWAQQGPYATVLLSDLGAEIIKIESREGERGRSTGANLPEPAPYFVARDRGKRSLTLDVRKS